MSAGNVVTLPAACPHCGMYHQATCPRVKAIEYHNDGTVKRIEFHTPEYGFPSVIVSEVPKP